jgi:exopolysaccharide biosynthesis polyprenyl glycosylphosphotransferase
MVPERSTTTERALESVPEIPGASPRRKRGWVIKRLLLAADIVGLVTAFALAEWQFGTTPDGRDHLAPLGEIALFALTLPAWIVVAKIYRLYDRDEERTDHTTADDIVSVFHLVTIGCWLLFTLGWLSGLAHPTVEKVFAFWALAIPTVTLVRATARAVARRRPSFLQNTVIVGAGDVGQTIARKLLQHPEYGINLVGFVDAAPKERRDDVDDLTLLGAPRDLPELVETFGIERVIVAFSGDRHEEILDVLKSLDDKWLQIDVVPRLFELVGTGTGVHTVEGLPVLSLQPFRLSRSSRLLKRTMDLVLACLGLVVLAPLLALAAVAIKVDSRGPVLFRQPRIGVGERSFDVLKLRTMRTGADERKSEIAHLNAHARPGGDPRMFKVADDPRVTRVGRFLRRYSLDELPQLVNVMRGEMSLVGPRPLIPDEDRHVRTWARRRLELKPGITGLWQVVGRSAIPFNEMVRLDYLYISSWSIRNDCLLLLRTIPAVLRGNGW